MFDNMDNGPDADLGKTIVYLAKAAELETAEPDDGQIAEIEADGITIRYYGRPGDWLGSSVEPCDLMGPQIRWEKLQMVTDGREMFVRCARVQSNELEGVFHLAGDSEKMLTRFGFSVKSMNGISHQSRTKQPEHIVTILENTQRCYNMIALAVQDPSLLTVDFITRAHAILLENDNLEVNTAEGMAHIVPVGHFRATPCYVCHDNEGFETHFSPVDQLDNEMAWFINAAQQIISEEDIDPFRAAAWIHHAFVRIHPFADGNGRMARIISSIPLLKAKLPPIFVAAKSKKLYFAALEVWDQEDDTDELARFLQTQVLAGLEKVLACNGGQDTSMRIQSVLTGSTDKSVSDSKAS